MEAPLSVAGWELFFVLPNVTWEEGVEYSAGGVALVASSDPRVKALEQQSEAARKLLTGFTTAFRAEPVQPVALIVEADVADRISDAEPLTAFRNCVAMAINLRAWAANRAASSSPQPRFSDYFDFYPVTITRDGAFMAESPDFKNYVPASGSFRGTPSPLVWQHFNGRATVNTGFLTALLHEWTTRYIEPATDARYGRMLFRSLEAAYNANRIPSSNLASTFDWGVAAIQWVSAVEILAHPKYRDVGHRSVSRYLRRIKWEDPRLNAPSFTVYYSRRNKEKQRNGKPATLVQSLYADLYDLRNAFAHGQQVSDAMLYRFGDKSKPSLIAVAPVLYWILLCGRLSDHRAGSILRLAHDDRVLIERFLLQFT